MLNKFKFTVPAMLAAALIATTVTPSAQAVTLDGNIDVVGAFSATDLLGFPTINLLSATLINLGVGHLNTASGTGVFAGLGAVTGINALSGPIICTPIAVVPPLLSSFTIGAYTFTIASLSLAAPRTSADLQITGIVTITDGNILDTVITTAQLDIDANLGFDLTCGTPAAGGTGGTGTGGSSSVPDSGTSLALFGCGLTALGLYGRARQVVGAV